VLKIDILIASVLESVCTNFGGSTQWRSKAVGGGLVQQQVRGPQ